jgi:hypothetical protein
MARLKQHYVFLARIANYTTSVQPVAIWLVLIAIRYRLAYGKGGSIWHRLAKLHGHMYEYLGLPAF